MLNSIAAGGASVTWGTSVVGFIDTESESAASHERPCINGLAEIHTSSPSFARSMD